MRLWVKDSLNSLLDEEISSISLDVVPLNNAIDHGTLRGTQLTYFKRYVVDDNKTLNNTKELIQLCTNLIIKLNLKVTFAELQALASNLNAEDWGFEEFKGWFDKTLLCQDAAKVTSSLKFISLHSTQVETLFC